jgi:hypothetical protein
VHGLRSCSLHKTQQSQGTPLDGPAMAAAGPACSSDPANTSSSNYLQQLLTSTARTSTLAVQVQYRPAQASQFGMISKSSCQSQAGGQAVCSSGSSKWSAKANAAPQYSEAVLCCCLMLHLQQQLGNRWDSNPSCRGSSLCMRRRLRNMHSRSRRGGVTVALSSGHAAAALSVTLC